MEDSPIHQRASKIRFRPAISWYLLASTALQWQQNCAHQTSEYFLPHLCCWITQFSQPRGAASPAILSETVAVDTTFSEKKRPSFIFVASDFLRYSKMVVHLYSDVSISKYSWDRLKTYCIGFRNTKPCWRIFWHFIRNANLWKNFLGRVEINGRIAWVWYFWSSSIA
jgi:hypothetical protein